MHKFVFLFLLLCVFCGKALADELQQAYEREFAYLVAEKKALEQRLQELQGQQKQNLKKVSVEIDALQTQYLAKQNETDRINRRIVEASKDADFVENDALLLETTLKQASESLNKLDVEVSESGANGIAKGDQLKYALAQAEKILHTDGELTKVQGQYFMPNGEATKGDVISVGRIAKYGIGAQGGGVLAPAGGRQFKVWSPQTQGIAQQVDENLYPASLDVFLFDNIEKGIEKEDEKTFNDDVQASGLVGKVIIVLGGVGFILVLLRIFLLNKSSTNIHKTVGAVNTEIEKGDVKSALKACEKKSNAVSKVIAATLKSMHKQRDHIEDIISESILHESSLIDRFGTAILVIAAISPLLGLLGTVTGMISTFDIITEYGTGDPKLLSSGISEALLTTKFGLVVAIPLLLVGNLLTSWGHKIKNELEQAALHILNTHKA